MQGVIYIRVSSDEQVKGTSLEHQEELCRSYCAQRGIDVVTIFKEEGESAKDLSLNNRKQFLSALEFCRKRKKQIQAFVVLRVDRFARNTEDHFAVRKILLDYGTTLHSVTEPIGNKPAEKFIETVLAGAAEYDNAIRKQRCTDGLSQRFNQGIYPFKPPLGYKCQNTKKHGEKKTQPDPPDPVLFPIIQKGLQHYAQGLCNISELARLLDKWGLKEIRGKKTPVQMVDRMLSDYLKFYAGILYNSWTNKEIPGLHVPMITKDEYYRILFVRSGKAVHQAKRGTYNPVFPLRKTIFCANCKRPMTGSHSSGNGGKYAYYHCYNKECELYGKTVDKITLEQEFIQYLLRIRPIQRFVTFLNETVVDLWKEKGQSLVEDVKRNEHFLKQLEERKKRICEMREDGSYTKEEFLDRKQEIENQVAAAKITFSESKIEQFDLEATITYAISFVADLGRQWFDLNPELRPRFQKLLFPEGILYSKKEGFRTTKLGLIYELIELSNDDTSRLVPSRGIEPLTRA